MYSIKMRSSNNDKHISGAETLCEELELENFIKKFFNKGFYHENGEADFLNLKIEKVIKPIQKLQALKINKNQKNDNLKDLTNKSRVSNEALKNGLRYIESDISYTGAIVLSAKTGKRLDSTKNRGIRVTNFAFKNQNEISGISERVQDALSIATCINAFNNVNGELCVSDDLNYTTGYYASPTLGYNRMFNIKKKNTRKGGRIIFVDEKIDLNKYINFLEKVPKQLIYH